MRTPIYLIALLGISLLSSCKLKSSLGNNGIINGGLTNTAGIYALRLCYETRITDGLEVRYYEPCSDLNSINGWNHLTYFEFVDDSLVEYHSLPARRKSKSEARKRITTPEFSGRYKILEDTISGRRIIKMDLAEKRKKIKKKNFHKQIQLEFVILSADAIQLRTIRYFDHIQKRVYDLEKIFPEKASFTYQFECVKEWSDEYCEWKG